MRVVLTAGNKSGSLVSAECAFSESVGAPLSLLRKATVGQMARIRLLYTEKKSAMFDTQLLRVGFSGLESLPGDPMRRPCEVAAFYRN